MTELHQPLRRCPVSGHAFIPGRGNSRYCSDQCAAKAREKRLSLHYRPPERPKSLGACLTYGWGSESRVTTVAADVTCGNCKRTDVWKKAVAD